MRKYEDTHRHQGMRNNLIKILQTDTQQRKGISSPEVLRAMYAVPRHFFFDNSALDEIAYEDRAFPIAAEQTISQPYTVAYQTQLLQIKKRDKVLEIGTGSAFQTIILAELGAQVFTIERQKELFEKRKLLPLLQKHPNIKFFYGDGFLGLPTFAPFDKIIVTAAAPYMPPKLIEQLKIGGCMVIPLNDSDNKQSMLRIAKKADGLLHEERYDQFSFVPMLSGKNC